MAKETKNPVRLAQSPRFVYWTDADGVVQAKMLKQCPKCHFDYVAEEYSTHIQSCNGKQASLGPPKAKVKCPYCSKYFPVLRLDSHIGRQHRKHWDAQRAKLRVQNTKQIASNHHTPTNQATATKPQAKQQKKKQTKKNSVPPQADPMKSTKLIEEAFIQSFDEQSDGSKHWGTMRREHGQFGSYPLFDDYEDESKP